MVYCSKCGTENDENAENCKNCGASLRPPAYSLRRRDWGSEDECFGSRSRTMWPIIIGAFLILLGLSSLLEDTFGWASFDKLWPLLIIAIGVLIVSNALNRY